MNWLDEEAKKERAEKWARSIKDHVESQEAVPLLSHDFAPYTDTIVKAVIQIHGLMEAIKRSGQ